MTVSTVPSSHLFAPGIASTPKKPDDGFSSIFGGGSTNSSGLGMSDDWSRRSRSGNRDAEEDELYVINYGGGGGNEINIRAISSSSSGNIGRYVRTE